jgi:hypothetical protein
VCTGVDGIIGEDGGEEDGETWDRQKVGSIRQHVEKGRWKLRRNDVNIKALQKDQIFLTFV